MRALATCAIVLGVACASPAFASDESYYVCSVEMIDIHHKVSEVFVAPPGISDALEADFRQYMHKLSSPSDWRGFDCTEFSTKASATSSRSALVSRITGSGGAVRDNTLFGVWEAKPTAEGLRRYVGVVTKPKPAASAQAVVGATGSATVKSDSDTQAASASSGSTQSGDLVFYLTTSIRPLSDPPTYNSMCVSNIVRRKAKGWPQSSADADRIIKGYFTTFLTLCRNMGGEVVDLNEPYPTWNGAGRTLEQMRALHRRVVDHPQNIPVNGL